MPQDMFRRHLEQAIDHLQAGVINEADNTTSNQYKPKDNIEYLTLQQYINNPTGKGSGYVAKRSAIKAGLNITFIQLLRKTRKQFYAVPYIYGSGDILYYVKVPSEHYDINKISYDVLFLIKYDPKRDRKNRKVYMFSNSPSFVFTYAYVFNQRNFLIDKIKSKLPNDALTKPPVIRNPILSLGYEKSTYVAARYLIDGGCLSDNYIKRYGKTLNDSLESQTFNRIADPETLVSIYQHALYNSHKTHKKQLTANQKQKLDKQAHDYEQQQKQTKPKQGFMNLKAPRSKVTTKGFKKKVYDTRTGRTTKYKPKKSK